MHDAPEAVEGVADLDHAQLQRAVAHFLDQRGQHGKAFFHLGATGAAGDQVGARGGDDELADEGDERVEARGVDAHGGAFGACRTRGARLGAPAAPRDALAAAELVAADASRPADPLDAAATDDGAFVAETRPAAASDADASPAWVSGSIFSEQSSRTNSNAASTRARSSCVCSSISNPM